MYLEPIDILQLSRTCRKLRDILMSKQSRSIWKVSRASINMPACPDDLSEAQYASLVFEKNCNVGFWCIKIYHKT